MTTLDLTAWEAAKQQAAYRVFENLIIVALDTGNIDKARSRYQGAKEVLNEQGLGDLRDFVDEHYRVSLV